MRNLPLKLSVLFLQLIKNILNLAIRLMRDLSGRKRSRVKPYSSKVSSQVKSATLFLILRCAKFLLECVKAILPKLLVTGAERAKRTSEVILIFSQLLQEFSHGNQVNNLHIAIAGYQAVLVVFTGDLFPEYRVITLNDLGSAYCELAQMGVRVERNLGLAIPMYQIRARERPFILPD
jgi:hypothetical protein